MSALYLANVQPTFFENSSVNIGTYSHAGAATDYSVVHLLINTITT